ncbi:MAG: metal-dependent hydrolase [Microthrixaceae bacterium]
MTETMTEPATSAAPIAAELRPSTSRQIPVRQLQTNPSEVTTDWIVPGDPIFSHLLATLSAVFPKGEDFFVASVRRNRDAVAEHFTGLLAEAVLDHEPTRHILFGQESIEPLMSWHALEELEHKNVAFDVQRSMPQITGAQPCRRRIDSPSG